MNDASNLRFDGRVAIVSGAGSGIGRASALALAARGAKVVVNDLGTSVAGDGTRANTATEVAREIEALGGSAVASTSSVSSDESATEIIQQALDSWGRLDILINNAGTFDRGSIEDFDPAMNARVMATHLDGTVNLVRLAWPHMKARGYGRIVNTSSAGVFGAPIGLAYSCAKAAVIGLTRHTALMGRSTGIAVNAVMPNAYTRMMESTRERNAYLDVMEEEFTTERVAGCVVALSHQTCPVNGEVLLVGGGLVARVFLGITQGVVVRSGHPEDIAAQLSDAMETQQFQIPADRVGVATGYFERLGFDPEIIPG